MASIPIKNSTLQILRVQVDPWAEVRDLQPGEECKLVGSFRHEMGGLSINMIGDNTIIFYAPDDTEII